MVSVQLMAGEVPMVLMSPSCLARVVSAIETPEALWEPAAPANKQMGLCLCRATSSGQGRVTRAVGTSCSQPTSPGMPSCLCL